MSVKRRMLGLFVVWLRVLKSKSWINGFRAIFCISLLRPLFLGEDGLRKTGGGKEGATKREDWMAAESSLGRHVSGRCPGTRGVHKLRLMRLGDGGAYLGTAW